MYGHRPGYTPAGSASSAPLQPLNPDLAFQNPVVYVQNLANSLQFQPPLTPNFATQNPSVYFQNLANSSQFLQNHPQFPLQYNPNSFPIQNANFPFQNPTFPYQQFSNSGPQLQPQGKGHGISQKPMEAQGRTDNAVSSGALPQKPKEVLAVPRGALPQKPKEVLERIDRAVMKARLNLLASKENVSAWNVSQAALVALQVDSWNSLGFQMQEIPSLHQLIVTEGKINAFIHCFVGVRRITSLYDLEVAICKNEGTEHFEELQLGPLLRHPLALHYFSVNSDATEVFKITTEEILLCLCEFMDKCKKKDIKIDELLDFIAKKRSVVGKEKLGVRIQSLGMHISFIREARKSENATLKKFQEADPPKFNNKSRRRPLFNSIKKQLDERFDAISQRVESFSSSGKNFCGKHIQFLSSSSEDEDSEDSSNGKKNDDYSGRRLKFSSQNSKTSHRVSSCPYPSAIEEMNRLGLKGEMGACPNATGTSMNHDSVESSSKKRKLGKESCSMSAPAKFFKRDVVKDDLHPIEVGNEAGEVTELNEADCLLSGESIGMFIRTWKDACREYPVIEVLERMLKFYDSTDSKRATLKRKRWKLMMSNYPFIGLLNVAVTSIKYGMWDSIYDTFEAISHHGLSNMLSGKISEYESIDVGPIVKAVTAVPEYSTHDVSVEEVMGKVCSYLELDHKFQSNERSLKENKFMFLRKLCNCETWLAEQFCVEVFRSLGHGDFFTFLEKHASLLPPEFQKSLAGDISQNLTLEVCMPQNLLTVLLSQASTSLWHDEAITKPSISALLLRQFPSLNFRVSEHGCLEDFLETMEKYKSNVISRSVLFSATVFGTCRNQNSAHYEKYLLETDAETCDSEQKLRIFDTVASKDAIAVLLRAPMLSDLNLWSHWDLIFAPSLGPLVGWLLSEVNSKELLCLVTADGKVIRLDHSATFDTFLEVALQGLPFQTAVQLLSLFSLAGGEKHVPVSLLKCHSSRAFEVITKNYLENMEADSCKIFGMHVNTVSEHQMPDEVSENLGSKLQWNLTKMDKVVPVASRFFLDCLGYLPSEFWGFAADVLLSGLRPVIKDAPSAILGGCKQPEQRLMLHHIGFSLGIVEWINDYHASCSSSVTDIASEALCSAVPMSELKTGTTDAQNKFNRPSCNEGILPVSAREDEEDEVHNECTDKADGPQVSSDENLCDDIPQSTEINKNEDAGLVIETIRRDEFGLDPNLSDTESIILKKQHARLGRALHCLSHELYSQDSHFLLELVQNADDNIYLENVEPTLTFILQESGIIVLNNEKGFSAENIRALCDVGNSTKKGSGAGYIGQKGIGFKSVFRVTDAPEIHSNGFHVKFDIGDGQIGFVLPTLIPPCNIDYLSRLVARDDDQFDNKCWNTCIILPFRSQLSEGSAMNNIVTMFSDLHPSLLLFLHRLKCIKFRNRLNDSLLVMRKEIFGNGIIKVSCGEDQMTWFVASQRLQVDVIRRDVQSTEIALAFTLQETDDGSYSPYLEVQPVFAFLPLRTYGLKFILQGDFLLPSSREEVDGDSPWNQWLLSEFPGLFVNAQRSFCALPCFKENLGKAMAAYLSFVPLVGEVHGFFSSLPRMIISKLRMSNCLLLEGKDNQWVPPCKGLRGWNKQALALLPDGLLQEHLGLGFLHKDIILSDSLARALGIEEYGPKVLLQILSSLCCKDNGLRSMGLSWLASWLDAFYTMTSHSSEQSSMHTGFEMDLINNLRKISFIPLSDGTYSSISEGTIWLHSDALNTGFDGENGLEAFPNLYATLRNVSPALLSAPAIDAADISMNFAQNITRMLYRIGVQQLSAHEIIKLHILPAVSDNRIVNMDKNLMIDYICFIMIHLQSSCANCHTEREFIISAVRTKPIILTNHGLKQPTKTSIHFSEEFGNPVDVKRLIGAIDMEWHEVDNAYLKHPALKSLSSGLLKWRGFFQEIGITDFVQVVQVDKGIADISHSVLNNLMLDRVLISPISIAKDWESLELVRLLSVLSASGSQDNCKYLLEVLDSMWDTCFSDKTTGYCDFNSSCNRRSFSSSFIRNLCDVQWVVSSMDNKLHYPKDLFHDSDAVRLIMGDSAPYAVPKVRSGKLPSDIGFKTKVTLDDILDILKVWRRSGTPFNASIAQMSRLYTFIWNEMAASKQKVVEVFHSGSCIFVPFALGSRREDVVCGALLSSEEVYWHDSTGAADQVRDIDLSRVVGVAQSPFSKSLCNTYPGLHDFFVNECGVNEIPPFHSHLQILLQLATVALPSQVAHVVFQVFLKWTDELNSGSLTSEDISHLKESLVKLESTVLPTVQDKWVSLHPSFGLVCWCDDKKLKKRFKHVDNIDFLYFGKLGDEQEMLQTKVSILLRSLGIPVLSEVVTREAIYYGLADSSFKVLLVRWALPFAQRYIYGVHPDKYLKLKQSGFSNLSQLQIIVVEKLFYRYVIKACGGASKKRCKCSCLLQGNVLYATQESDSHTLFLELSRFLFDGTPELHLANFLHMVAIMAESGSTEEQTEFFILNSQKVPRLPDDEAVWCLVTSLTDNDEQLKKRLSSTAVKEQVSSKHKRKGEMTTSWPPADWKTAPDFSYARANGFKTWAAEPQCIDSLKIREGDNSVDILPEIHDTVPVDIDTDCAILSDMVATSRSFVLPDSEMLEHQILYAPDDIGSKSDIMVNPVESDVLENSSVSNLSKFRHRDRLHTSTPDATQAILTGRLGERVAFKYFTGIFGKEVVNWVNEERESGLPYDIVIEKDNRREYIEVKATKSGRKDWFIISTREWKFAFDAGETFSILHVWLQNDVARVTTFKNPVKLCQQGKLQLVVMMPKEQNDFTSLQIGKRI
ncbi:hypothetical protein HS088_TW14G00776 [Tripterygium wilfordii]|uniref:Protein NO VEIN C-terminal domain-containing protein n=1 Tax=Tripterygium wilfordii TaxID=458696 RepID=A0A7J7CRN8_TRIWF|nr:protein NO VEIN [Tripterygium wilfordii]KAF5736629.1 hypothetical protein HS088_TW14G00776 [Tripterygium wilfordii]